LTGGGSNVAKFWISSFRSPDVADGGHARDGEVATVWGCDSPGAKSTTLVPKWSGLSLQVDPN